jgi:hypothetical protein
VSADILQFRPKDINAERDALITQARENYDSIFPATPPTTDGGKARLLRRRDNFKFRHDGPGADDPACDELLMDHVDTGIPCDVAYCAPDSDPA